MVSPWLIVVASLMAVITIGLIFYLVVLFSSEEDKNQAYFPKFVVIFSLSLACFNVLLLPYDVANKMDPTIPGSFGEGIDVVLMWQIILFAIAALLVVIVPFCIFYYEAADSDNTSIFDQLKPAILYTTASVLLFGGLLLVLWFTVGKAKLPYQLYSADPQVAGSALKYYGMVRPAELVIHVSFFVYTVGLMSTIGWLLLASMGGVGLVALPWDLILDFKNRPVPLTAIEYAKQKEDLSKEIELLIPMGKKIEGEQRSGGGRKVNKKANLFKSKVAELENRFEKLEIGRKQQGGKILVAYLKLVLGVLAVIVSLLWVLHIIVNNVAHANGFLNVIFIELDHAFSLLGTVAYGIFAFYLLWCVVKGVTKVGVNLLIFTVHPMKINDTLMNAFLFNTLLILMASVTVVQFCAASFSEYASNTAANAMFTTYVRRLEGIGYIVRYLQYGMLGFTLLSFLWLLFCPKRKVDDD